MKKIKLIKTKNNDIQQHKNDKFNQKKHYCDYTNATF